MKRHTLTAALAASLLLLAACGDKSNSLQPMTGLLPVVGEDSCRLINYNDEPKFVTRVHDISLYYNGLALVCDSTRHWGYINGKGDYVIPAIYDRATVFSEGLAWVYKKGDMPGAIDNKRKMKISLRDAVAVRAFHEGQAAFATVKKGAVRWGFLNKQGNESVKAQYKEVRNFSYGLAAVQDIEGRWGYIDLDSLRLPHIYNAAYSFDAKGHALVHDGKNYITIDREGNMISTLTGYEIVIPDGELYRVCRDKKWGWCNAHGHAVVNPVYDDCRPFGAAQLAPVMVRGKWAYVDRNGKTVVKRQFSDAYPFIDGRAAVQVGSVWGFIDENGVYAINPQYDSVPRDYLQQALGEGSAFTQLDIPQ